MMTHHRWIGREEALRRGLLIDVSPYRVWPGSKLPVPTAISRAAWQRYFENPARNEFWIQLGECLWLARYAIDPDRPGIQLGALRIPYRDRFGHRQSPSITLVARYGFGDRGERVLTILLPEEI